MRIGSILIMAVSVMNLLTSIFIFIFPKPTIVARLGIFYHIFPMPYVGATLMLFAAILALVGLAKPETHRYKFLYYLPQHVFLLLTAGSAIDYIILQRYADGVLRSWQFILQDQLPILILTFFYAFSIFNFKQYGKKKI